jgi:16S rRNA (guanine966-N2)-methyltransferase
MRIISGKFGGRKFYPPADKWPTRPTTDISKEGLFNVLNNRLDWEEVKMLDLFGGTGNHCYEFISRGCIDATYVDQFMGCIKFVQEVSEKLNIENELRIVRSDVFRFIASTKEKYDYIFAGPPYPLPNIPEIPDLIFEKQLLATDGLFVLGDECGL